MVKRIFALWIFWSLQSCGLPVEPVTKSETTREPEDETYQRRQDSTSQDPLTLAASRLEGSWAGPCRDATRVIYVFSRTQWVRGTLIYSEGADCTPQQLLSSYEIGGYLRLEGLTDNGQIQWQGDIVSLVRAFYTQELVDYVNSVAFHGFDDWQVDERRQCIGLPENDETPAIDEQTIYSLFEFSESGTLTVGGWATASDRRPDAVFQDGRDGGPFYKVRER